MTIEIPSGTRPGDTPSGIKWPRRIWLILPDKVSASQHESIAQMHVRAGRKDDLTVSAVRVKTIKGVNGREFRLLRPNDVAAIYRGMHIERTAILAFCGVKVLLDISERPSNQGCMALEKFVRHKCFYTLVSRPQEVPDALTNALAWMDETCCEGPRDPRCFPAAIFLTREDISLATQEDRRRFNQRHKSSAKSSTLADTLGRSWQIGPYHTRDLLQVAGTTLPVGFHWDVNADNRSSVIATGWETWKLPGGGYTNIHPNAYIRGGNATKTHSFTTESQGTKSRRTPRNYRKGKGQR